MTIPDDFFIKLEDCLYKSIRRSIADDRLERIRHEARASAQEFVARLKANKSLARERGEAWAMHDSIYDDINDAFPPRQG